MEAILLITAHPSTGHLCLKNTSASYRLGHSIDETSQLCDFHIGQSHFLECWDIGSNWSEDTFTLLHNHYLLSLFDTLSDLEILSSLSGDTKNSHDLVRKFIDGFSEIKGNFEDFLKLGVSSTNVSLLKQLPDADEAILKVESKDFNLSENSLEVLLIPDFHTWDGQFSNNGWMMECPHPITKLTWDNALLISPVLAKRLEEKHPKLGLLPKATMLNKTGK